jgi:hypothetical protein
MDGSNRRVRLHRTGWGDRGEWDTAHDDFNRAWGRVPANLKQRFERGSQDWRTWLEQLHALRAAAAAPAPTPTR